MRRQGLLAILPLLMAGCVSTSQFCTGRTMSPHKFRFTAGMQNLAHQARGGPQAPEDLQASHLRASCSMGLPARMEWQAGIMPLSLGLEFGFRWELTPPTLPVDIALGGCLGTYAFIGGYHRASLTASHDFGKVEPYMFVARYHGSGSIDIALDDWVNDAYPEAPSISWDTRTLGGGLEVPVSTRLSIIPELRYDWVRAASGSSQGARDGVGFLSLGIAIYPD